MGIFVELEEIPQNKKRGKMYKLFSEIKIGDKFYFISWLHGEKIYIKMDDHHARVIDYTNLFYFYYNDVVRIITE